MVSALDAARGALTLASNNTDQSYWQSRQVTHWSTHICMVGAFIGCVALLVGVTIDSIAFSTLGAFLFVTNALASYYLKKFSVFFSVDEVIRALSETVLSLYNQVVGLHNQIAGLEPARERLIEERKKIESRLKESQAAVEKLQKVEKEYHLINSKLMQITNAYNPLKGAIDAFIKKVGQLQKADINFEQLNQAMKALTQERTKLEANIQKFDTETKELDEHEKRVGEHISQLSELMDNWNGRYVDLVSQNSKLSSEVDELKKQLGTFTSQNKKAEALVKQVELLCQALPDQAAMRRMIEEIKAKA